MDKAFTKRLKIGKINDQRKEVITNLVWKYRNIYEVGDDKFGRTNVISHRIKLKGDQELILQRRYRVDDKKRELIGKEIEMMLKEDIIRESDSPWGSLITLPKKKNGRFRFCIDYRKLNAVTIFDTYLMLRTDELLERFCIARWFTTIDLAAGFH